MPSQAKRLSKFVSVFDELCLFLPKKIIGQVPHFLVMNIYACLSKQKRASKDNLSPRVIMSGLQWPRISPKKASKKAKDAIVNKAKFFHIKKAFTPGLVYTLAK